jgi:hypothetical protein
MSDEISEKDRNSPLRASVRSEPIKNNYRRKFDKAGLLRAGAPPEEESELPPEPAPAPPKAAPPTREGTVAGAAGKPTGKASGGAGGRQTAGAVDFQSFVYFLYMSALHELGVPAEPGAPARPADLERARFFVEVLQVIDEKTKGNLSPGESRLLEEALYNLRMQYVGASGGGPA